MVPSFGPTVKSTDAANVVPSADPSGAPTVIPSANPTGLPTPDSSETPLVKSIPKQSDDLDAWLIAVIAASGLAVTSAAVYAAMNVYKKWQKTQRVEALNTIPVVNIEDSPPQAVAVEAVPLPDRRATWSTNRGTIVPDAPEFTAVGKRKFSIDEQVSRKRTRVLPTNDLEELPPSPIGTANSDDIYNIRLSDSDDDDLEKLRPRRVGTANSDDIYNIRLSDSDDDGHDIENPRIRIATAESRTHADERNKYDVSDDSDDGMEVIPLDAPVSEPNAYNYEISPPSSAFTAAGHQEEEMEISEYEDDEDSGQPSTENLESESDGASSDNDEEFVFEEEHSNAEENLPTGDAMDVDYEPSGDLSTEYLESQSDDASNEERSIRDSEADEESSEEEEYYDVAHEVRTSQEQSYPMDVVEDEMEIIPLNNDQDELYPPSSAHEEDFRRIARSANTANRRDPKTRRGASDARISQDIPTKFAAAFGATDEYEVPEDVLVAAFRDMALDDVGEYHNVHVAGGPSRSPSSPSLSEFGNSLSPKDSALSSGPRSDDDNTQAPQTHIALRAWSAASVSSEERGGSSRGSTNSSAASLGRARTSLVAPLPKKTW